MYKHTLSLFLIAFAGTAAAHSSAPTEPKLSSAASEVRAVLDGNEERHAFLKDLNHNSTKAFVGIQALLTSPYQDKYMDSGHKLLVDTLKTLKPGFSGYWDHSINWKGSKVFQNHDLFDMERQQFSPVSLAEVHNRYVTADGNHETAHFTHDFTLTRHRLLEGKPAIGPDGGEIYLCRLVHSDDAPYFEITQADSAALINFVRGNMTITQACLNKAFTQDYWENRRLDFIDDAGDRVPPVRTLQD